MRSAQDIEKLVSKIDATLDPALDQRISHDMLSAQEQKRRGSSTARQHSNWRMLMKSTGTRFAAAGIIILGLICINVFIGKPAWAIEQTVQALKKIQTISIEGTTVYYDSAGAPEYVPFKCWVKLRDKDGNVLLRMESSRETVVVQGEQAYFHRSGTNRVKILKGKAIDNLRFWYRVMELSPWLSGKMLLTLRPLANDWREEQGVHGRTDRDCVFVNCNYEDFASSFWFVFDIESKLIVEAKHWGNTYYEDPMSSHAMSFVYNDELPDDTFDFPLQDGMEVVYQKDIDQEEELMKRGLELFRAGQYADALKVFQNADIPYMAGMCYGNMGEHEKAIQCFIEEIEREEDIEGSQASTYFYLGIAYKDVGQKGKEIEAFEKCIDSGAGFLDSEAFPMKNARSYIEKLKDQK